MNIIGIIPARFASTRFPGKPLVDIGGKSMIKRVYEQAKKCSELSNVIVATEDEKIFSHVKSFGGEVMMTSPNHISGTERCAEVAENIQEKADVIFNIQGDEPFIQPEQLSLLAKCFHDEKTRIATLAKKITDAESLFNPNVPKVILNSKSEAIYFSRAALPFYRGANEAEWTLKHQYYKHIGIYAYRTETLKELAKLQQTPLEKAESLEQLRWLENGFSIKVALTEYETISIDVPEDLEKVKQFL